MPDTNATQEVTRFVNSREGEAVHESEDLTSKAKHASTKNSEEDESRKERNVLAKNEKNLREAEKRQLDKEGSEQMVDEGDPNTRP